MPDPSARLYLITPRLSDHAAFAPELEAALSGGTVSCVLLNLAQPSGADAKKAARALAEIVQRHNAALLVANDPQLALRANADGAHISDAGEALAQAIAALRPAKIVGAGGLKTKDAAMSAGEAGADYVMFGEPAADGWTPPFAQTLERARWWTEIFSVPCVAYAQSAAEAAVLAQAQCEFIALGGPLWSDKRGIAAALAEVAAAVRAHPLAET